MSLEEKIEAFQDNSRKLYAELLECIEICDRGNCTDAARMLKNINFDIRTVSRRSQNIIRILDNADLGGE